MVAGVSHQQRNETGIGVERRASGRGAKRNRVRSPAYDACISPSVFGLDCTENVHLEITAMQVQMRPALKKLLVSWAGVL